MSLLDLIAANSTVTVMHPGTPQTPGAQHDTSGGPVRLPGFARLTNVLMRIDGMPSHQTTIYQQQEIEITHRGITTEGSLENGEWIQTVGGSELRIVGITPIGAYEGSIIPSYWEIALSEMRQ